MGFGRKEEEVEGYNIPFCISKWISVKESCERNHGVEESCFWAIPCDGEVAGFFGEKK